MARFGPIQRLLPAAMWLAAAGQLASESYNHWAAACFTTDQAGAGLAAPVADPDGDGSPNWNEYAFGTDPFLPSAPPPWTLDPAAGLARVCFPPDRPDTTVEIECSSDLVHWQLVPNPAYHSNSWSCALTPAAPFLRLKARITDGALLDSDGDGLHDLFEQALLAADPGDPFDRLDQIRPEDDFDSDGTPNLLDPENRAPGPRSSPGPMLLDPHRVAAALASRPVGGPASLAVHTPLD